MCRHQFEVCEHYDIQLENHKSCHMNTYGRFEELETASAAVAVEVAPAAASVALAVVVALAGLAGAAITGAMTVATRMNATEIGRAHV